MTFYHIDHKCSIQSLGLLNPHPIPPELSLCNLFPSVSQHGLHYLLHHVPETESLVDEIILEYIRSKMFPNMPSRFQCIFAATSKTQAQEWMKYWKTTQYNIVQIESDNFYELDASWFSNFSRTIPLLPFMKYAKCIEVNSIEPIIEAAVRYWKGEHSPYPQLEVLIPLPCWVSKIDQVRTS